MVNRRRLAPYAFITPFLVLLAVFWIWPVANSIGVSLTKWNGFARPVFVGLRNYVSLFRDVDFLTATKNTLLAAFVYLLFMGVLSLALGLILDSLQRVPANIFRTIYFLPVTVTLVVGATIFQLIYSKSGGLLNGFTGLFGAPPIDWLGNGRIALWSIVGIRVWRNTGYYSLFIIAGMQNIPEEVNEAAKIDGASEWARMTRITIPLLRPMILYVLVTSTIWALQLFDEPWILLKGGPGTSTLTMAMTLYRSTFKQMEFGYGAAISYVLTMIMVLFSVIQMRIFRQE
jgi:ABC-type sugar transport system permease subunit